MRDWLDKIFGAIARAVRTVAEDGYNRLIVEGFYGRNVPMASSGDPLGRTLAEKPERDFMRAFAPDHSPDQSREHNRGIDLER